MPNQPIDSTIPVFNDNPVNPPPITPEPMEKYVPPMPVVPIPTPAPIPTPTSASTTTSAPTPISPTSDFSPATPNVTAAVNPPPPPFPASIESAPLPHNPMPPAPSALPIDSPPPPEPHIQKSPFRFLIPILAIGILVLMVIFGVQKFMQSKKATSENPKIGTKITNIIYWGLWEPSVIMGETLAAFEAQNPDIKVTYQQQSITDYRERLQNALKNSEGPDIFRYHMTWTPLLVNDLEAIPAAVLSSVEYEAQQYPIAQDWLKSSKGYVGIPLMYEGLGLLYNQTMFEAAGKTPPKTWEELRRLAVELTVKNKQGGISRAGVALGSTSNVDNWSDIVGLLLLQNAANPAKPNNALGQGALTFYTLFNSVDKVWDETLPSSTVAFASEKVAMIIVPSWRALEIKNMNPNIKFGVAPLPQVPDTQISWASFWAEGVSSKSDNAKKAAAWKLISFLNQKDTLRNLYAAASKERLFGEMFARTDMADQLTTDPYVGGFISQAKNAKSWYLCSRTFDNGPNDKIIKYYEDAINAINKGEAPATALGTVEAGVGQIISQYRLTAP